MDSSTIGDSLIRINRLVKLTTAEVLGHQRLNLGNTGGTTDENNIVDLFAGNLGVLKNALDRVKGRFEHGSINFLKTSPADACREVLALSNSRRLARPKTFSGEKAEDLVKRIDFDGCLSDARQGSLRTFASASETSDRARII